MTVQAKTHAFVVPDTLKTVMNHRKRALSVFRHLMQCTVFRHLAMHHPSTPCSAPSVDTLQCTILRHLAVHRPSAYCNTLSPDTLQCTETKLNKNISNAMFITFCDIFCEGTGLKEEFVWLHPTERTLLLPENGSAFSQSFRSLMCLAKGCRVE